MDDRAWMNNCFLQFLKDSITRSFPSPRQGMLAWWRHQMERFSALLAICAGNSPVTGEFATQRPVTRSFDVYFDLRPKERLSKQWWGWWFETLSRSLWRHRNGKRSIWLYVWITVASLVKFMACRYFTIGSFCHTFAPMDWVIIGSGNALCVLDSKPLPETMLTYCELDHLNNYINKVQIMI